MSRNPSTLTDAAEVADLAAVSRLLAAGEDPNGTDEREGAFRPLHRALRQVEKPIGLRLPWLGSPADALEIARLLVAAGADPNARALERHPGGGETWLTPLHIAVQSQSAEGVRMLLAAGADPHADSGAVGAPAGRTPLEWATYSSKAHPSDASVGVLAAFRAHMLEAVLPAVSDWRASRASAAPPSPAARRPRM